MGTEDGILLLPAINDDHGGVVVTINETMDSNVFRDALIASMSKWKNEGKRGVWIELPIELAHLVEIVVKEGFWYHHAEPKYLMLVHWIPESTCTIPANATHRVGVGAIVITDKREMLVVQENSGKLRGTGVWKIPTGVVDEGEDICVAAVREVKEETGIDAEFVEKQDLEIEAAQWMSIEEYATQPSDPNSNFSKHIADLCLAKLDKNYAGFSAVSLPSSDNRPRYLYKNTRDLCSSTPSTIN